jgi:hypothetical protein
MAVGTSITTMVKPALRSCGKQNRKRERGESSVSIDHLAKRQAINIKKSLY